MSDVKWIKITTDIFDDEKILLIESLPEADSIIVIWFKLLALAGKQNNNGVFLMSNRIPYTEEMLSTIFRRNLNTVRLALKTFVQFGMVEIVDNVITIPNWDKHQSLDAYDKKKARDRLYQQNRRAVQKALIEGKSPDASSDKSSDNCDSSEDPSSDVAVSDKEGDKEIDKENIIGAKSADPIDGNGNVPLKAEETKQDGKQEEKAIQLSKPQLKKLFSEYTSDEAIKSLLLEWCEIRRVKKGVNSETAIRANLKKLQDMANQSSLTIKNYLEEVISRSWLAFYPIRSSANGNSGKFGSAAQSYQFPPLQIPMRVFDSSKDDL